MNDLKFTNTHEWLQTNPDEVTIGISEHAQQLLGDLVFIELPEIGASFNQGDEMAVVESVKAASDVYAPISGVVTAINEALRENPALINQDPYQAGWMVKLKPNNPDELGGLLDVEQYQAQITEDH